MKIIIVPAEEEIMKIVPRRAGVEVTLNKHELEVTGLNKNEEDELIVSIQRLFGAEVVK